MTVPAGMSDTCPHCGCTATGGAVAHAISAALMEDDLDRAIDLGLLDAAPCPHCEPACGERLVAARDARHAALAARERYRMRQARLQRRADERAQARRPAPVDSPRATQPALPSAAAAALARAKARAAERHKP